MVTNKLTAAIFAEVILFAVALGAIFLYTLPGATVLIVFPQTRYNASARCFLVSVYQQPCQHTFQNTTKKAQMLVGFETYRPICPIIICASKILLENSLLYSVIGARSRTRAAKRVSRQT